MSEAMKVLVVDEDQAFRESMVNLLLICGVDRFEVASSTEEALEKVSDTFFEISLVNLMPQMRGLQLAEELKEQMPKTKIILVMEDTHPSILNGAEQLKLNYPIILKSFVSRTLPQLLSEETLIALKL
ncbi:response regulator [bacterium]|nr:response regulator [bacterium]